MKRVLLKLREAFISVLPVTVVVLILAATPLVNFTGAELGAFCVCAVFLILGIGLFNLGADLAMTPMGEQIGGGLTKSRKIAVLLIVCFLMGVLITVAEPDLSVLAEQVKGVMNGTLLIVTVGVGVGLFLLIAVLKIIMRKDLSAILMFFYMTLFALCALLIESGKNNFLAMCFDSGGVTTGPITVPFIMALGVGIATTIGGKNSNENSFGLVALCSIGPILAVIILSMTAQGDLTYSIPSYTVASELSGFGGILLATCREVVIALALIIVFFVILQLTVLKLPRAKIIQIIIGITYTFVGLVVFLTAVKVGFMPIGLKLGKMLAENRAVLIAFGLFLGMVVVLAEPAIHVLNKQVEEITGGNAYRAVLGRRACDRAVHDPHNIQLLGAVLPNSGISAVARTVVLCAQTVYGDCVRFRRCCERSAHVGVYPAHGDRRMLDNRARRGFATCVRRGGNGRNDPADNDTGARL